MKRFPGFLLPALILVGLLTVSSSVYKVGESEQVIITSSESLWERRS